MMPLKTPAFICLFTVISSSLSAAAVNHTAKQAPHSTTSLPSSSATSITFKAVGTSTLPYTDSPVMPRQADITFPYRTIGKLWFTKPDGSAGVCTGSVINPGMIVTAGHCIHSGKNADKGWFSNFRFAPAHRKGISPFGVWTNWEYTRTPTEWFSGNARFPHAADYGLIVFNKNSNNQLLGDLTGTLGYDATGHLIGTHVTVVGYSKNLDKGVVSHRVDSNVIEGTNNTGVFGSNMTSGSDGSPIILNFGEPSAGDPSKWTERDRVVSVVSYSGPTATMKQGGSQFDQRFVDLINETCKLYAWAC